MSKIDDINGVLAIISANGANEIKQRNNISNNFQSLITKKVYKQFIIKFFLLIKSLLLLESVDPYDSIYENYWKLVFNEKMDSRSH